MPGGKMVRTSVPCSPGEQRAVGSLTGDGALGLALGVIVALPSPRGVTSPELETETTFVGATEYLTV